MTAVRDCRRNDLLLALVSEPMSLTFWDVTQLKVCDLTTGEKRGSGFLPIRRKLSLRERVVMIPEIVRRMLDEYLNTEDPDEALRPFKDYRPNVGSHLFPSATTGRSISSRAIRNITKSQGFKDCSNRGNRVSSQQSELSPVNKIEVNKVSIRTGEALQKVNKPLRARGRKVNTLALLTEPTEDRHEGNTHILEDRQSIGTETIDAVHMDSQSQDSPRDKEHSCVLDINDIPEE